MLFVLADVSVPGETCLSLCQCLSALSSYRSDLMASLLPDLLSLLSALADSNTEQLREKILVGYQILS